MKSPIQFLYSLQTFGMKLGLRNITTLLGESGNPERLFPSVHIAGTNGKGSTAAMLAVILTASGYRTGLYTSPHLVRFNERIRIDGIPIPDPALSRLTKQLRPFIVGTKATFFEATTAIAFHYFAEQQVDIAVIETGLGGRFDATNVLQPLLSIITGINFDHTEHLGTTLASIAFEKGGIIKNDVPCLTGVTQAEALGMLKEIATKKQTTLVQAGLVSSISLRRNALEGVNADITTPVSTYRDLLISMPGVHQARNAQLALLAAEYLNNQRDFHSITKRSIRKGLSSVQSLAGLHGRLDVVLTKPLTIIDVAHNPDGLKTAIGSLQQVLVNKPVVVFGVMEDKEYSSMIPLLAGFARLVIAVQPKTGRALPGKSIVRQFHSLGFPALDGHDVASGFNLARSLVRNDEAIVIIGSHYVAGEVYAMSNMQGK